MSETRRFKVDYESFLSQHDVVFKSPAEPYEQKEGENFIDGPLMGNGDVGLVVHGTPDKLLFNVGKNDVWDRREGFEDPYKGRPPVTQAELIEYVNKGQAEYITDLARNKLYWPYQADNIPPMPKPVGRSSTPWVLTRLYPLLMSIHQRRSKPWSAESGGCAVPVAMLLRPSLGHLSEAKGFSFCPTSIWAETRPTAWAIPLKPWPCGIRISPTAD